MTNDREANRPDRLRLKSETLRRFLVTSAIALGIPAAAALPVVVEATDGQPAPCVQQRSQS